MSTRRALRLIHFVYATLVIIAVWVRRCRPKQPKPLNAQRSKVPKHLCLNLVANNELPAEQTETTFLQCLQDVATWCRVLGIETLTVYDRHGVLYGCSESARQRVFAVNETSDGSESEVGNPLMPPLSATPLHPPKRAKFTVDLNVITMMHLSHLRKRTNVADRGQSKRVSSASSSLTLHIVSRASGKPAIASAGRSLLQSCFSGDSMSIDTVPRGFQYKLTVSKLAMVLEAGLPSPDLMIIHHVDGMSTPYPPIELHGFPPWQNTLTEFHRTHPDDGPFGMPKLISETAFCRALDEYSGAEFRLGR